MWVGIENLLFWQRESRLQAIYLLGGGVRRMTIYKCLVGRIEVNDEQIFREEDIVASRLLPEGQQMMRYGMTELPLDIKPGDEVVIDLTRVVHPEHLVVWDADGGDLLSAAELLGKGRKKLYLHPAEEEEGLCIAYFNHQPDEGLPYYLELRRYGAQPPKEFDWQEHLRGIEW